MSFSFTARANLLFDFLIALLALAGVLNKVCSSANCSNLPFTSKAADVAVDFRVDFLSVAGVLNKV